MRNIQLDIVWGNPWAMSIGMYGPIANPAANAAPMPP